MFFKFIVSALSMVPALLAVYYTYQVWEKVNAIITAINLPH